MLEKHTTKNALKAVLISPILALSAVTMPVANAAPFDQISITSTKSRNFSSYDAVYIAPVEVSLPKNRNRPTSSTRRGSDRRTRPVSETDQTSKANDLYEDMSYALGQKFELADGPGTGILTIETIITDLKSTRPTSAELSNQTNLDRNSLYTGGASANFILSENGTELATLSDKFGSNLIDGRPRVGVWADTDRAFKRWSKNMAKYIAKN